jgi:orotidine-5'-phosphate decarboxylase
MGGARFADKLAAAVARNDSLVCVGLDPDPAQVPDAVRARPDWLTYFAAGIVEATADIVCCYKPNAAFYEALGEAGQVALRATVRAVPDDVPTLLDAKRGDVGVSARAYASAVFDDLGADAVTVSPYLGFDTLEPFLAYRDRGVFVLCKTSNPGSAEFQDQLIAADGAWRPLYETPRGAWRFATCARSPPTCRCWCRASARRGATWRWRWARGRTGMVRGS